MRAARTTTSTARMEPPPEVDAALDALAASPLFRLSDVFAAVRSPAVPVVDFGPALPPALPPAASFSMKTVAVVQRPSPTLRKTTTLPWKVQRWGFAPQRARRPNR